MLLITQYYQINKTILNQDFFSVWIGLLHIQNVKQNNSESRFLLCLNWIIAHPECQTKQFLVKISFLSELDYCTSRMSNKTILSQDFFSVWIGLLHIQNVKQNNSEARFLFRLNQIIAHSECQPHTCWNKQIPGQFPSLGLVNLQFTRTVLCCIRNVFWILGSIPMRLYNIPVSIFYTCTWNHRNLTGAAVAQNHPSPLASFLSTWILPENTQQILMDSKTPTIS